jgi:hypothetical protein
MAQSNTSLSASSIKDSNGKKPYSQIYQRKPSGILNSNEVNNATATEESYMKDIDFAINSIKDRNIYVPSCEREETKSSGVHKQSDRMKELSVEEQWRLLHRVNYTYKQVQKLEAPKQKVIIV